MSVDYTPPTWVFKCAQGHRCEGGEAVAAEALRELAALKARRCDGCAWATPLGDPEYIACRREGDRPVDWYCADFTPRTAKEST